MRKGFILGLVMILLVPIALAAAPAISSIEVTVHPSYVELLWKTNEQADSRVDYGTLDLTLYKSNTAYTTNHRLIITGLDADVEYQYKLTSCRDSECSSTEVQTFLFVKPDTTAPVLEISPVEEFTFLSSVDVEGSVDEPCTIYVTANGADAGNFSQTGSFSLSFSVVEGVNRFEIRAVDIAGNSASRSFTVTADPNPTTIVETNLAQLDMSSNAMQTLFGVVSKPNVELTIQVEGKNFTTTADSEGRFSIEITLASPTSGEERVNGIIVWAQDEFGRMDLVVNGSITFVNCGQGSGYSVRFDDVTPDVITPSHLINGMAQIGFRVNLIYIGGGSNTYMVMDPAVTIQNRMSDEKKQRMDEELFAGAVVQCNDVRDQCYVLVNLAPWPGTVDELRSKLAVGLPLMLRLQYTRSVGGVSESPVQDVCLDLNLMLDVDLFDTYKINDELNSSIEVFQTTIGLLETSKEYIDAIKSVAIPACFGASAWDFTNRLLMTFACAKGNADAQDAFYHGLKSCTSGDDACQNCLDAKWRVSGSESTRNLVCDRLFCPAVPTLDKHQAQYYNPLTGKGSVCALGYASSECQKEFKLSWDTASILDEYSMAAEQAGIASTTKKKSVFGEMDELIRNSNLFCPAVKGTNAQIVRSGGKDYYVDESGAVYELWRGIPAEMVRGKVYPVPQEVSDHYDGSFLIAESDMPEDIKRIVKGTQGEEEKQYVFDPTSSPYNALLSGCLPAISGYIDHWEQILGAVEQCLQMVQVEGEGTPGVCKAVMSQYVCDVIWDAFKCTATGLSAGGQSGRFDSGLLGTLSKVSNATLEVSKSVTRRYGETGMYDVMFKQNKLIYGTCMYFFTGGLPEGDLSSMFTAEMAMPVLSSEGLIAPATRRFITSNPFQNGWATWMYHMGYALNSGAEISWELRLECGNDMQCTEFGGACDCFAKGEKVTKVIGSGVLPAGQFVTDELYFKLTEAVRFDRAVLEWSWTDNTGSKQTDRITKQIKSIGETPPKYCAFNQQYGEYQCEVLVPTDGQAFFSGTPTPSTPPGRQPNNVFQVGDRFVMNGQVGVRQPEGLQVPKLLEVKVYSQQPEVRLISSQNRILTNPGVYYLSDFSEIWPVIDGSVFTTGGVSECERYDPSHPARWTAQMVIYKMQQNAQGLWEPTTEVALYEGNPQQINVDGLVACSSVASAEPLCQNGALTINSEKCRCGGQVQDPKGPASIGRFCCKNVMADGPCDAAAPKFKEVTVKRFKDDGSATLGSAPVELQTLGSDDILIYPAGKKGLNFTSIKIEDASNVEVSLLYYVGDGAPLEYIVYPMGPASGIGGYFWNEFDMAGFTEHPFTIQLMAKDENGLKSYYPADRRATFIIKESEKQGR